MKIVSWNVNGIRTLKNGIKEVIDSLQADILCLQEVKASRSSLEDSIINVPGYSSYFNFPKHRSGYSGVATFCSNEICPKCAEEGLSGQFISSSNLGDSVESWPTHPDISCEELKNLESEGRAIITKHSILCNSEVKDIAVINVYCPRVDCLKPERQKFQLDFFKLLERRANKLYEQGCGVIIVGDINTCRHPIDSCDPGEPSEFSNRPNRKWLNSFVQTENGERSEAHFIDSFRYFYPEKKNAYTCWSTLTGARKTNYGTRIDYMLVDKNTITLLEDSTIFSEFEGSDHCPVGSVIKCQKIAANKCPSICSKYWPEFAGQQKKLTTFLTVKEKVSPVKVKRPKCDTKPKQLSITSFLSKLGASKRLDKSSQELCQSERNCHQVVTEDLEKMDGGTSDNDSGIVGQSDTQFKSEKSSQVTAWKLMLKGPPKPPMCSGHNEACLLRTVQKVGPNYGRQFFVCSRPIGDKSNKEARCDFFKWATDVKLKCTANT